MKGGPRSPFAAPFAVYSLWRPGDRDVVPLIPLFCVTVCASCQIVTEQTELCYITKQRQDKL